MFDLLFIVVSINNYANDPVEPKKQLAKAMKDIKENMEIEGCTFAPDVCSSCVVETFHMINHFVRPVPAAEQQ